jgi:hypothetical protein
MLRKRYTAEQIIGLLRQAEVELAQGRTVGEICRGLGMSDARYYRWRVEYGGLKVDQARRLKKRVIGDGLRSQINGRQATEVAIAADVLKRMLDLGRPEYARVA